MTGQQRADDVLEVLHFVFPDGTCLWVADADHATASKHVDAWKAGLSDEQRRKYEAAKVYGGFVQIRMLRSDYERVAT